MNKTELKRLNKNNLTEFKDLIKVFNEVFEMQNGAVAEDDVLKNLLDKTDFIGIAAIEDGKVVGGLTAYEFPAYYGNYNECYIYDIAVKAGYQRQGIGKMLIESIKKHCSSRNVKTMFVEAHEQDAEAVK